MHKVLFVNLSRHSEEKPLPAAFWNRHGFDLSERAYTPESAVSLLAQGRFALSVIHIQEAHSDGIALCRQIRLTSRIPIILTGGDMDFQLARKAMHYQVNDYLPAPFNADEFAASLQSLKHSFENQVLCEPVSETENNDAEETGEPKANVIVKVKEYVEEALHQNITLKEISNIMHFNCSYLGQKFKVHEKMTFNEYLLQQRMEKAKDLLEQTNMKIYEIANKVGYTEIDWFYKKFKSYTGVSANEYRKMCSITA